ncbi:MAG: metallophosphoesterase [Synergistaceae bacterium]|nr:metallophosphoesterase [Synergistaceae bacterium]
MALYLWLMSAFNDLFIFRKLREAGVDIYIRNIFLCWAVFWFVIFLVPKFLSDNFIDSHRGIFEIIYGLSFTWIVSSLIAFFAFVFVDLITGLKSFTSDKVLVAALLTLCCVIFCMAQAYFVVRRDVVIKTHKINTDKIRIVYLTDLHLGGIYTRFHFERVMKIVRESQPDIFILCGDIIDGDPSRWPRELAELKQAALSSRYGAFAVNGNHEYYYLLDFDVEGIIRDSGFNMMINERAETAGITIIGLDDCPRYFNSWLKPYLKPEDKNRFVLVIKHRPGLPADALENFDLQISGHTHGGQFWPMGYFKSMSYNSQQGLSQKAGGLVYVSNGAGFNGACMRLFTVPEVTVIDIVKE